MARGNDPHKGKISRAFVFRCLDCDYCSSYEWDVTVRLLRLDIATAWARRDGWSKTKDGWKCSTCKAKKPQARNKVNTCN